MDFTKYFDKKPLTNYALGPSGSGVLQVQPFTTEWTGSFDPQKGVTVSTASGQYFYKETAFPNTMDFSFSFDEQSNFWFAYGDGTQINVSFISGNSKTNYQFAGASPQLFNNSVLKTGSNQTYCFYLKGDSNIYQKNSSQGFGSENVFHSGDIPLKKLQNARKLLDYYYRFGLFYSDVGGDGHYVISDKFPPMVNQFYRDFESQPTGETLFLFGMQVESNRPSGYFVNLIPIISTDYMTPYPTGNINLLNSGNNMGVGFFLT